MIKINPDKCVKCGMCIRDCIVSVLTNRGDGMPHVASENEKYCLNCQHCLAICPSEAVSIDTVTPKDCPPIGNLPNEPEMRNLLRQRRSIRQYKNENVSPEVMEKLKNILSWTPTGCNDHKLYFAVVEDKTEMEFFRKETNRMLKLLIRSGLMTLIYPNFKRYMSEIMNGKDVIFRNAPHMIVAATPKHAPCAEADPWIALSYFDLYAQSLGIGTCWCGFALHAFKWNRKLRRLLNLPSGYKIGSVLLFGPPAVDYMRATDPEPFPIHTVTTQE